MNKHRKERELFLEKIKKDYDLYGWGKPINWKEKKELFREVILLCPNMRKKDDGTIIESCNDRNDYLRKCEEEAEALDWVLEEYDFDFFVLNCPNYNFDDKPSQRGLNYSSTWEKYQKLKKEAQNSNK